MEEKFRAKRSMSTMATKAQANTVQEKADFSMSFTMRMAALKMSSPTAIWMPRKALATRVISRNWSRNMEMA